MGYRVIKDDSEFIISQKRHCTMAQNGGNECGANSKTFKIENITFYIPKNYHICKIICETKIEDNFDI